MIYERLSLSLTNLDTTKMDMSKFDVILDSSSESFVEDFKKALGLLPGETLQFVTPQFTRTDGRVIQWTPKTAREFDALKVMKHQHLKDAGCQKWNETPKGAHWLYPFEWYDSIPNGYEIVDINWQVAPFMSGVTDNDTRYGALAFGFIQSFTYSEET